MEGSITVTIPKGFAQFMLGGAALLCLVPVGFALAGELPPAGAVIFALLIAPFIIAGVLWPRFRVVVRQGAVIVRPCFGRAWQFEVADITRVVRRVNPNSSTGELAKMTVWAGCRRVSVEALMRGSEAFWAYVERNVDSSRIITKGHARASDQDAF